MRVASLIVTTTIAMLGCGESSSRCPRPDDNCPPQPACTGPGCPGYTPTAITDQVGWFEVTARPSSNSAEGSSAAYDISLTNHGPEADNVLLEISVPSPALRVQSPRVRFGDVATGQTVTREGALVIDVSPDSPVIGDVTPQWTVGAEVLLPPGRVVREVIRDLGPTQVDRDELDGRLITTRLDAWIHADSQADEVNAALRSVGGRLVTLREGSLAVTVSVPRGGPEELLEFARELRASPAFVEVSLARTPAPVDVSSAADVGAHPHRALTRLAGAWNGSWAHEPSSCRSAPIRLILGGDFGGAEAELGIVPRASTWPSHPDANPNDAAFAQLALEAIAPLPLRICVDVHLADLEGLSPNQQIARLVDVASAAPTPAVLALSARDPVDCILAPGPDGGANPLCASSLGILASLEHPRVRARRALDWLEAVPPLGLQLVSIVPAGDARDPRETPWSAIYPGLTNAQHASLWAFTTVTASTSLAGALSADLWRPTGAEPDLSDDARLLDERARNLGLLGALADPLADNVLTVGTVVARAGPPAFSPHPGTNAGDVAAPHSACLDPRCQKQASGTAAAAAQAAGLATLAWARSSNLQAQGGASVARLLRSSAQFAEGARLIDGLASSLALDLACPPTATSTEVRRTMLDIDGNGAFDDEDLARFFLAINEGDLAETPRHRFDLNADGQLGPPRGSDGVEAALTGRFDLNLDGLPLEAGVHSRSVPHPACLPRSPECATAFRGRGECSPLRATTTWDETRAPDQRIVCHYAFTELFSLAAGAVRRDLLCGEFPTFDWQISEAPGLRLGRGPGINSSGSVGYSVLRDDGSGIPQDRIERWEMDGTLLRVDLDDALARGDEVRINDLGQLAWIARSPPFRSEVARVMRSDPAAPPESLVVSRFIDPPCPPRCQPTCDPACYTLDGWVVSVDEALGLDGSGRAAISAMVVPDPFTRLLVVRDPQSLFARSPADFHIAPQLDRAAVPVAMSEGGEAIFVDRSRALPRLAVLRALDGSVYATVGDDFSSFGLRPGISGDGRMHAFRGRRGSEVGVFLQFDDDPPVLMYAEESQRTWDTPIGVGRDLRFVGSMRYIVLTLDQDRSAPGIPVSLWASWVDVGEGPTTVVGRFRVASEGMPLTNPGPAARTLDRLTAIALGDPLGDAPVATFWVQIAGGDEAIVRTSLGETGVRFETR